MASFYERMQQEAQARSSGVNVAPQRSLAPKGTLFKILDYMDRPRMSASEAIQAAMAGEDVGEAALRGLKGLPKYGTLGEAAFPAAAEPGFQPEDIPAFAIDFLTDPTTWIGPGVAKAVGKPVAKGLLKAGSKLVPTESRILRPLAGQFGEAVKQLPRADRIKMIKGELKELGMSQGEAYGRVFKLVPKEAKERLRQRASLITSEPDEVVKKVDELSSDALDVLQDGIRELQANIRPDTRTSLNSLAQDLARRALPSGAFLRKFMGSHGAEYAKRYNAALFNTDKRLATWANRLEEFKNLPGMKSETIRKNSSAVREGLAAPINKESKDAADNMGKMLNDFFEEITNPGHNDEFGQGLMVLDVETDVSRPLVEMFEEGYFPRRVKAGLFTGKGRAKLVKDLKKAGLTGEQIEAKLKKLDSIQPKKVGHVEFARMEEVGDDLIYEQDPMVVLPKYMHDVIWRQELGKQFGMNNQMLDELTEQMIQRGMNENYIRNLNRQIIGRNPYYDAVDNLMRGLGTFQAVSKLGFATSVSNMSQAINQGARSGFENLFRSTAQYAKGDKANLGMLALSRRAWGDIAAAAGGGQSGILSHIGDKYMRGIGFNMSERIGRHIGAIGGDMEVQAIAKKLRGPKPWYIATEKKWAREKLRLASELKRKYGVAEDMIGPAGQLAPEVVERAAWDAARVTMHAFDPMQLPPAFQDPTWKMLLQFKSFIYKQTEFQFNEVMMPAVQWMATNGTKGDIQPFLRSMIAVPAMGQLVSHSRDVVKSLPSRIVEAAKNYQQGKPLSDTKWDYKDPFWEDADPVPRILSDAIYMGMFGIVGDMYESARMGRLTDWLAGPTIGDFVDVGETLAQRRSLGKLVTQSIPGAVGIPYNADIFEAGGDFYTRMMRELARRREQGVQ